MVSSAFLIGVTICYTKKHHEGAEVFSDDHLAFEDRRVNILERRTIETDKV